MAIAKVTTLDVYIDAVLEKLREVFDDRVLTYTLFDENLSAQSKPPLLTPALLFNVDLLECDYTTREKDTKGRITIRMSNSIRLIMSLVTPQTHRALNVFSSAVMSLLMQRDADTRLDNRPGQRWGLSIAVEPVESANVVIDDWVTNLNGCAGMVIRFNQMIYVSDTPLLVLSNLE